MSRFDNPEGPVPAQSPLPGVETVVVPRTSDIGHFAVRRAIPTIARRTVGPFVFLDEFGPTAFAIGEGLDVAPHPHIGLATVTYLLEGAIEHRDSLGSLKTITPGAVNWMSAGRGIAHSERTGAGDRGSAGRRLAGLQLWVALPRDHEDDAPFFASHAANELPIVEGNGTRARVVVGSAFGAASPVATLSDTLFVDLALAAGSAVPLDATTEERAVYVVSGTVVISGDRFEGPRLLLLRPGDALSLRAETDARAVLLGGAALDGPRHVWWNFVATSKERIEAAKADWRAGRFPVVPGETDLIPLPER